MGGILDSLDAEVATHPYESLIEAFKFAYGQRSNIGDAEYEATVVPILEKLVASTFWDDTADKVRDLLEAGATNNTFDYYDAGYVGEESGTSHISVITADESVSLTSSINLLFGSKIRGNMTGIVYNNHMDDFSTPGIVNSFGFLPSSVNFIKPGKRPQSSMCPAILKKNGKTVMTLGGSGGSRITTGSAFVAYHVTKLNVGVAEAVSMPRIHHQLAPMEVRYQPGFDATVLERLATFGHTMSEYDYTSSAMPTLYRPTADGSSVHAKGDNRKPDSTPAGF